MANASVVLVHGANSSPASWDPVVAALEARGVGAVAADLPTMRRADATFADDVAHVHQLVTAERATVLCGRSYGGAVITEAGVGLDSLTHLVYLAALMPDEGETLAEWAIKRPSRELKVDVHDDGTMLPTVWVKDDGTYDATVVEWFKTHPPRPMAVGGFGEPLRAAAWRTVPSTYVVASNDTTLHPDSQREMAARATHVMEMDCDHAVSLVFPDEIAELLASLAAD